MAKKEVFSDGNYNLGEFQTIVQQQEGIFGPLISLSTKGDKNKIELEIADVPNNRAILEIYESNEPQKKEGHVLICKGNCFVNGNNQKIAAYRKN